MKSFKQYIQEKSDQAASPEDPKLAELIDYLCSPPFNYVLQPMDNNSHIRLMRFVKNNFNGGNIYVDNGSAHTGKYFLKCTIWSNTVSVNYPAPNNKLGGSANFDQPYDKINDIFKDIDPNNTFWLSFTMKSLGCALTDHVYTSESGIEEIFAFYDKLKPMFEGYNAYENYPNPDDYVGRIVAYMNGIGLSKVDQLKFKQKMGVLSHEEIGDEDVIGML